MHLFSQSLSIVLRCGGELLNVSLSSSSVRCIRWPGFALIRLSCHCVIDVVLMDCVCCTWLIWTRIIVCPVSCRTRIWHYRAAAVAHPLEFEVSRCRRSQFARCFLPAQVRMWNDHPYTDFDTGTLVEFEEAVNHWLTGKVARTVIRISKGVPWVVFFHFFVVQVFVGLRKQFTNNFVIPTWACAADFNNNNGNNK